MTGFCLGFCKGVGGPTTTRNTLDIAARLVPRTAADRDRIVSRMEHSALDDYSGGVWYLHRGDLTIDGGFDNIRNLVVDGNLTEAEGDSLEAEGDSLSSHVGVGHLWVSQGRFCEIFGHQEALHV